ncbi:MAG: hypothetical protein RML12_04420 [Xanthomonadales bacterium]|nr:hypothetical protein [Xanthomonadales bacterium]
MLTDELAADLSPLKLVLKLGDRPVGSRVQMRIEMDDKDCRHIVQLAVSRAGSP